MLEFCCQELCRMDGNGRVKLSPAVRRDFARYTDGEVVLNCMMPERAVAVYPPSTWETLRRAPKDSIAAIADDVRLRRQLRRFGALSRGGSISNQGRVTIPPLYREYAGLDLSQPVMLVGNEIGIELWRPDRWEEELALIEQHSLDKGKVQMNADIREDD